MDRRLLFPVITVTAWAQPTNPAAVRAEKALRDRAQQFFQLQVEKKFRVAEAFVAEDSKEEYYNGSRYNIKSFSIQKIELLEKNKRAKVTIISKVTLMMPGVPPMDFDTPSTSEWKLEKGQWFLYIDPNARLVTPFGKVKPGDSPAEPGAGLNMTQKAPPIAALLQSVRMDRNTLVLSSGGPPETVTVSNGLPGGADLEIQPDLPTGLSADLERKHLEAGEKTTLRLEARGEGAQSGKVHVRVLQTGVELEIGVTIQ